MSERHTSSSTYEKLVEMLQFRLQTFGVDLERVLVLLVSLYGWLHEFFGVSRCARLHNWCGQYSTRPSIPQVLQQQNSQMRGIDVLSAAESEETPRDAAG